MDVRCEKCRTEYELDESKLKPGGVTVKCTNCGHMFKVRRRITAIGPAVSGPPTLRGGSMPASAPRSDERPPTSAEEGELTWLIRQTDGEIMTCRELATLQKWIVAGRVDRECEISRTGKKWKRLGEIGELASFFEIADEARQVAGVPARKRPPSGSHPHTVQRASTGGQVVAATPPAGAPHQPAPPRSPAPSQPAPPASELERTTGQWVSRGVSTSSQPAPAGPTGGLARSVPTTDAAFTNHIADRKGEYENGVFIPTDQIDADPFRPPGGGIGKWIASVAIVLILGGSAALYLIFANGAEPETAAAPIDAAPVAAPVDAADVETEQSPAEIVAAAGAEIAGDTTAGLEVVLARLSELAGEDAELTSVLVARARLGAALAQHAIEESERLERPTAQKQAITRARELADAVEKQAIRVLAKEPDNAAAMVARADALRIRNRPAREVERWIRRALEIEPDNRDAALSRAHLYIRDRRSRNARKILEDLPEIEGDVRAAFLLARLDVADESWESAKTRLTAVLAAEKEHARAAALAETVEAKLATATAEPEDSGNDDDDDEGDDDDDEPGIDSYDRLLARADKLAENGSCDRAMAYYDRALRANPAGVGALTGLGYCHLEARQFSSAYAKFRAALGISSRYQAALWGMGELYERQGSPAKAIAAYRDFIEAHPTSKRAEIARRKIEALGGSSGSGDGSDGAGSGTGDGGGSGSGADSGDHDSPPTPPSQPTP